MHLAQTKRDKDSKMFLKVEIQRIVVLPPDQLYTGLLLQRAVIIQLLKDIEEMHASREYGYFMAVTELKSCGQGTVRDMTGEVVFPVVFECLTFKPVKGEILQGITDRVLKHGVMLKCGPIDKILLSNKVLEDFRFVPGENPFFINSENLKLVKEGTVRFRVMGVRWMEIEKEFQLLATLEGDYLGPIS